MSCQRGPQYNDPLKITHATNKNIKKIKEKFKSHKQKAYNNNDNTIKLRSNLSYVDIATINFPEVSKSDSDTRVIAKALRELNKRRSKKANVPISEPLSYKDEYIIPTKIEDLGIEKTNQKKRFQYKVFILND